MGSASSSWAAQGSAFISAAPYCGGGGGSCCADDDAPRARDDAPGFEAGEADGASNGARGKSAG